MGGCASRPKESPETLPTEAPVVEGENAAPENNDAVEEKKEEPLVDLSETKTADAEAESEESKASDSGDETKKPAEDNDEGEAAKDTEEPKKEEKEDAEKGSEDKSDAPLVTV